MFFKKIDKLGRVYYYRENGKRVPAKTVKNSKKKVTALPVGKSPAEVLKMLPNKVKRAKEAKQKPKEAKESFLGRIKQEEYIQQRVTSRIRGAFENGDKVGMRYKGKIYQISPQSELDFIALWESLESKFMDETAAFQDSPTMTIGGAEGMKGVLFDFDQINWFGYSQDEGKELLEEFPQIYESIRKTERYFNNQFNKFLGNAKKTKK